MKTNNTNSAFNTKRGFSPVTGASFPTRPEPLLRWSSLACAALLVLRSALAQSTNGDSTATLTTADANSTTTTSFNSTGHWSPSVVPKAGYVYIVDIAGGNDLRTPANGTSYTFGGDALTINGSAASAASPCYFDIKSTAGAVITVSNLIFTQGGGVENGGNASVTLAGNITLATGGGIFDPQPPPGILNITAPISGIGPMIVGTVTSGNSGGTIILSGNNTYTGGTYFEETHSTTTATYAVASGNTTGSEIIQLGNLSALGNTTNSLVMSNGILDLHGFSPTVGSLSGLGGAIANLDPANSAVTLTIGNGGYGGGTFSGIIRNTFTSSTGTVGLTMAGSGTTITLNGANTYTGMTTVSAGTLAVNSPGSLNVSGSVSVDSGATLAGTGTAGNATISSGGNISGSLTLSSLTFSGFSTMSVTQGTSFTATNLTANGSTASVTINAVGSATWPDGAYPLITYSGSIGGTGFPAFVLGTVQSLGSQQQAALSNANGAIDLIISGTAPETTNYLTAADANSASATSFSQNVGHWTDDLAPHPGAVYIVSNLPALGNDLRTLAANVSATFLGDSLLIGPSSTAGDPDWFDLKGTGTTTTTVTNLIFNGGGVENGGNANATLAGNITLLAGGGFFDPQVVPGILTVTAPISGSGPLIVGSQGGTADGNSGGIVVLVGTNTYTGGTYFQVTQGINAVNLNDLGQGYPNDGSDILQLGSPYALGNPTNVLSMSNGVVDLNTFSPSIGNLTGPGGLILNDDTGGSAVTLTIGTGGNGGGTYAGVIMDTYFGSGTVGLTMVGSNTTITLIGTNTYSSPTTINAGTLTIESPGSLNITGTVLVNSGGTLAGTGSVGNVTVAAGGTLAPGDTNAIGTITVEGTLSLGGTVAMRLNHSSLTSDTVQGAAAVVYGGTLSLTNLAGTVAVGDTYTLFTAGSYTGSFSAILPATPGPGLQWNTSGLAVNGQLTINSVAQPSFLAPVLSGTNLVFSGTGGTPGGSYVVVTSTNLAVPLPNWIPLATNSFDGSGNFSFTNSISPATAAEYFVIEVP